MIEKEKTIVRFQLLIFIDHDISDSILSMMELASKIINIEFNEDLIDGGVEGICVSREEDMIVSMCHIAECLTFNSGIDTEVFTPSKERQKILYNLLSLLNFI